jgi:hypothetical protein
MRRREVEEDDEDGEQRPDASEGRELGLALVDRFSWKGDRLGSRGLKLFYFRFEEGCGHSFIRLDQNWQSEKGS